MSGKRWTRYFRDPAFRAEVDEQLTLAAAATVPGVWITYAIHDPTLPDHIGAEPEGLIIYIGQSKEYKKRARKRFSTAGATRRPTDRIDGACYDIMRKGRSPKLTIRDRQPTAIDSLISETNTAKKLLAAGYPLLNKWTEQKFGGLAITRDTVPHEWLWRLTAGDAIGSNIDLIVREPKSGREVTLSLSDLPPNTLLRDLRATIRASGQSVRLHVR